MERDLYAALENDAQYQLENDAKFRAVAQRATYEEFRYLFVHFLISTLLMVMVNLGCLGIWLELPI